MTAGHCGVWMKNFDTSKEESLHSDHLPHSGPRSLLQSLHLQTPCIQSWKGLWQYFGCRSDLCRSPFWQAGPQSGNPQRLQTNPRLLRVLQHCKHWGRHRVGGDKIVGLSDRISSPVDMIMLYNYFTIWWFVDIWWHNALKDLIKNNQGLYTTWRGGACLESLWKYTILCKFGLSVRCSRKRHP